MRTTPRGFTLIEILVSTAIFIIVMVIALGALLSISAASRKAETVKIVMDNLNFALDSMSRSIRTGLDYDCGTGGYVASPTPTDCPIGNSSITFNAAPTSQPACTGTPCVVTYCRGSASSLLCGNTTSDTAILRDVNNGGLVPITSSEVIVSGLTLYVVGAPRGDSTQPKVTVTISGYTELGGTAPNTTFNVQTSLTQRLYDQ